MTKSSNKTKKVARGLGRGLSTLLGDAEARDLLQEHPIYNETNNLSKSEQSRWPWNDNRNDCEPLLGNW